MASPGGRSAALTAVTTPGARRALDRSTARTLPCATGERTILAHSSPPAWNPSAKAPRPRSSLGSSLRGTRVPITGSEEHTSELQSHVNLVCRLLLEKKKIKYYIS